MSSLSSTLQYGPLEFFTCVVFEAASVLGQILTTFFNCYSLSPPRYTIHFCFLQLYYIKYRLYSTLMSMSTDRNTAQGLVDLSDKLTDDLERSLSNWAAECARTDLYSHDDINQLRADFYQPCQIWLREELFSWPHNGASVKLE